MREVTNEARAESELARAMPCKEELDHRSIYCVESVYKGCMKVPVPLILERNYLKGLFGSVPDFGSERAIQRLQAILNIKKGPDSPKGTRPMSI